MWMVRKIKQIFNKKPRNNFSELRLDPNDNQYRGMKFEMKAMGGLYGQIMERASNFTNPKRLDEE
jgi:hypothetical protein